MAKPIRNITIVGGGTAGWMSALLLTSLCKTGANSGDKLKITLIESPNIPTVGVGEATVPSMPRTLKSAGISEQELLQTCNATFKLGVLFDHWNVDRSGNPIGYVNPFARGGVIDGVDVATYFQKFGAAGLDFTSLFSAGTYQAVLMGKQVYDTGWGAENPSGIILLDPEKWQRYLTATRAKIAQTVQLTADHRSLLRELRGEVQPTTLAKPWALTGGGFAPPTVAATVAMPGQKAPKTTDVLTKGISGEIRNPRRRARREREFAIGLQRIRCRLLLPGACEPRLRLLSVRT